MTAITASIQHARDTESNWSANNPNLLEGMIYISSDVFYPGTTSPKLKIGTGAAWAVSDYLPAAIYTAASLGLGNVDNTSDINKPVSTLQAAADAAVQAAATSRANHTGTQLANTISNFNAAVLTVAERLSTQASIAAAAIDWDQTHSYKTLTANTTFTFSNAANARTIIVAITNNATNFTVTWPTVDWGAAGAPTQRTGTATDIYTFTQINGVIYGSVRQ